MAPVLSSVNRFARSILLHPLFFCSGSAYPSQREQAMRAEAYAYFVKPLDFECLLQTIAKSLNSVSNRSFAKASSY
jgi:DNA-binding NtrC family response regulator